MPVKINKIFYSVNEKESAFNSLSFTFVGQKFVSQTLEATNEHEDAVCNIKIQKSIRTVKIKQRNTPEGVSKICGLHFQAEDGTDLAKIDLCEGLGTWRVQTIEPNEKIIGFHYYRTETPTSNDETTQDKVASKEEDPDDCWLDSLGFMVYRYELKQKDPLPPKPRGRPRLKTNLQ